MGKKVLYISGSLGLGHVFRDLAIVKELRKLKPDIDLYWLAEQPVTDLLTKAGEKVLPESYSVCNELMRKQVDEKNQVNFTRWLYAWSKFFDRTFQDYMNILQRENFDLVIGDEAYELAIGYSKKPELLDRHFVMMWDFVKVYPMTKNPIDHIIAWAVNQNWDRHYRMMETPYLHNIFFGELEDTPDESLGLFLVNARDWGKKYCDFARAPMRTFSEHTVPQAASLSSAGH